MKTKGQRNTVRAASYSKESIEEARRFPKSGWYREDLAPLLGKYVTLDCGSFSIEESAGRNRRAVLRDLRLMHVNSAAYKRFRVPDIDHLWVLLDPEIRIDVTKKLRITGVFYEYAHRNVRNIGIRVVSVAQY